MNLEKFNDDLKNDLKEAFDATPTNINPGEMRISSPSRAKRGYLYGTGKNRKGTFRSTAQSRRENLKNVDAENIMPAIKEAFDYVVALSQAVSPALGSQMRSRLNTLLRNAQQKVEQEKKRQDK